MSENTTTTSKPGKKWYQKNIKTIVAGCVVLIILVVGGFWYYTTTPRYAISEMNKAAKAGNYEEFSKYVNEDELFENIEARYRAEINKGLAEDESLKDNPFASLATGLIDSQVKAGLLELKTSFRADIEKKETYQDEPQYSTINQNGSKFTIEGSNNSETGKKTRLKFKKIDNVWQMYDFEEV